MPYTEAQKRAIYKWMDTHREQYRKLTRDYGRRRYANNEHIREAKIQKVLDKYYFKKELKIFLNILIADI